MRTLRLSLVGAVILVLLGGLGSAIVAQDEETGELSGTAVYIATRARTARTRRSIPPATATTASRCDRPSWASPT